MDRRSLQRARLASVGLTAIVLVQLLAGCEPLSSDELRREVEGIGSIAAEGAVLADQVAGQRTKRTFARVHARELGDGAEHSEERLVDAHPADGLTEPTADAITLAGDVSEQIGEVEVSPDDAATAQAAAEELRGLAQDATELAGSL